MTISMRSLADDPLPTDQLGERNAQRSVATVPDAARQGRFAMTLTTLGSAATAPS